MLQGEQRAEAGVRVLSRSAREADRGASGRALSGGVSALSWRERMFAAEGGAVVPAQGRRLHGLPHAAFYDVEHRSRVIDGPSHSAAAGGAEAGSAGGAADGTGAGVGVGVRVAA